MNSVIKDIGDYLTSSSSGLPLVVGTNLFLSYLPDSPDKGVCVFEVSGGAPTPNKIFRPFIQILCRGEKGGYESAYSLLKSIVDVLHELSNITINGTRYIQIRLSLDINHVGNDRSGRPILSSSFSIQRT